MLDRTKPPKSYLLDDLTLADVQLTELSSGVKLHILADDTNPVIKVDIFFPTGKCEESIAGAATLCGKLMMEGTLSYSSSELQETLDHYGAHADVAVGYDETTFSMVCLKEYFTTLLPLLKSVITEPLFDDKDFEKLKFQMIQKAKVNNGKNGYLATKALRKQLLKGSPYALVADENSLAEVSIDDVKSFYANNFSVKPQIIIAGEIDKDVESRIEDLFGILTFKDEFDSRDFKLDPNYETHEIKREGSVQASIRLASLSIDKSHPDYFKLAIANEMLGGFFGSRLMKNIREDKGYTYGIYSTIINYRGLSYHIIGADVKLDAVDDAIHECRKELDNMQSSLVSEDELSTLKNYLLGKLAGNLDTIFSQSDNYKSKVSEGVDYQEYFDNYVKTIRSISAEDIREISAKYFSQEYCVVKVV
jgi:predicted Zn-dependent peptidase